MLNAHITKLQETDNRLVGASLVVIGLGWVSFQPLVMELTGTVGLYLSMVAFGSAGIGIVHSIFGIFLIGNEQLDRSVSFSESVLTGVAALVAGGGALITWEFIQSGVVRVETLMSFPFFACYVAAWGFPLGFATSRRQRLYTIGGLCAIPIAILLAIPLLYLIGGGWVTMIAMVSLPVILALLPLMLLLAVPLLIAGWSVRAHHAVTTK